MDGSDSGSPGESTERGQASGTDDIEALVDRKVAERLEEENRGLESESSESWSWSRRNVLGMMGGLAGLGGGDSGSAPPKVGGSGYADFEVAKMSADHLKANRIDVRRFNMDVIYVDSADEIQPAIDELSERVVDGNIQSGVVRLGAKEYHPSDTIWLKRGVVLEGTASTPWHRTTTRNGFNAQRTKLGTSNLPEGRGALYPKDGANTWTHFDTVNDHRAFDQGEITSDSELAKVTHPHLALINNFGQVPVNTDKEPTEYQRNHRGVNIGLRNLTLEATKKRWWNPNDEPSGSDAEWQATYHGVYDGLLFEKAMKALVENVRVRGFLGYNGFYQDTVDIISRGNRYGAPGTATDYHGSTLTLDYSSRDYVKGVWSVDARGPVPTVKLSGHMTAKIQDGAWRRNPSFVGTDDVFLGSESDYKDGRAPIVDGTENQAVVNFVDQQGWIQNISVYDNTSKGVNGISVQDNKFTMDFCRITADKAAIKGADEGSMRITNSILRGATGINQTVHQGYLSDVSIVADDGISVSRANSNGGYRNVKFTGSRGIVGSASGNLALFNPDFTNLSGKAVTDPTGWRNNSDRALLLVNPLGYTNENADRAVQAGDGSQTSFTVAHNMDEVPVWVQIQPMSKDATSDAWVSVDESSITINYITAPPSGTDNLQWGWYAKGWSAPGIANI
jgi:hypothetical protein